MMTFNNKIPDKIDDLNVVELFSSSFSSSSFFFFLLLLSVISVLFSIMRPFGLTFD